MTQPNPHKILQITPVQPETFGVYKLSNGSLEISHVALWALVSFENENDTGIYGCYAADGGIDFFETAENFVGYAQSRGDANRQYAQ